MWRYKRIIKYSYTRLTTHWCKLRLEIKIEKGSMVSSSREQEDEYHLTKYILLFFNCIPNEKIF